MDMRFPPYSLPLSHINTERRAGAVAGPVVGCSFVVAGRIGQRLGGRSAKKEEKGS